MWILRPRSVLGVGGRIWMQDGLRELTIFYYLRHGIRTKIKIIFLCQIYIFHLRQRGRGVLVWTLVPIPIFPFLFILNYPLSRRRPILYFMLFYVHYQIRVTTKFFITIFAWNFSFNWRFCAALLRCRSWRRYANTCLSGVRVEVSLS